MLKKQFVKQAIEGKEKNGEILAISNKYKDIFDNFINSLDIES